MDRIEIEFSHEIDALNEATRVILSGFNADPTRKAKVLVAGFLGGVAELALRAAAGEGTAQEWKILSGFYQDFPGLSAAMERFIHVERSN